jgi:hydrogenase-4 component B
MSSNQWVLASGLAAMASGLPAACLGRRSNAGQIVSCLILVAANVAGLAGVALWWREGPGGPLAIASPLAGFSVSLEIDAVSAFFLVPILVVTALASIYGLEYWRHSEHPENARRVGLFFGLLTGAMTLLVVAHDGLMFLLAWEIMAVSAFVLVASEDHIPETRRAAWLYIATSHFATLCLFGVFALLYAMNGSFELSPLRDGGSRMGLALAMLALMGFGAKAGIMPLHFWLPSAHAQAPSHVSAVMSGVLIKMGIYGLVRIAMLFPASPLSWGYVLLALGVISAVLGVAFAVGQHDIKRLLAYHSIENIGIIVMGLGLAMIGRAVHEPLWVLLGICGAALHVWNHALFKSLLFLGAGSVVHAVGTREIDVMGGLSKRMPLTANCFLLGAVAICGLPPLNGFISELFIYLGLFHTLDRSAPVAAHAAAFAAPALALVGGLAVACFVKVYGIVFLGAPRTEIANHAHEAGRAMTAPMLILAACCIAIGVAPLAVAPFLDRMARTWGGVEMGGAALAEAAPLAEISIAAVLLIGLLVAGSWVLALRGVRTAPRSVTWDCGYAAPSPRMQYTSSSFAQMLVRLFGWALQPSVHAPKIEQLFPEDAKFQSHVDDTVLEKAVWPGTRGLVWLFSWARYLQQGSLQAYLMYIVLIIVALLLWG